MEVLMKVDPTLVKKLREARAWSQDHLAQVSGLSLRTIQRVEADGTASAETKMAIASAFGFEADALTPRPRPEGSRLVGARLGTACGFAGVTIGAVLACIGVANGSNTAYESGVAYGFIGLLSGLCCAIIGTVSNRYRCAGQADA
jgi:DNA-binding XRE family transcriptional regulator